MAFSKSTRTVLILTFISTAYSVSIGSRLLFSEGILSRVPQEIYIFRFTQNPKHLWNCRTRISHSHLVPRSKKEWNYTSTPPVRFHGVVLS